MITGALNLPILNDDNIRIELIVDCETTVGYCISTIEKKVGEIDSIYIEEKYRENGYGTQLIENSKKWLNENNVFKNNSLSGRRT